MVELKKLYEAILDGKLEQAKQVTIEAIEEKIDPQILINDYMSAAMEEVGARFETGKAYVPELLLAGRAMKGSLDLLKPLMTGNNTTRLGTIIIGTVKGDLHDIGKNLVASMLEGSGFEVINMGTDVSSDKFVTAIHTHNAQIVCLSALLTTTMNYMKDIIEALQVAGIREKVKVMVGGAPITSSFSVEIGADGYSDNANSAVLLAKSLIT